MSAATQNAQRGNGPFFLYIEGLPRRYTWQDLKDMIRRQATHGVWTEMAVYPNGQTGGKGHARIQRSDEAYKLYNYLTQNVIENRSLNVHLWDISGSLAVFIRCNCGNNQRTHPHISREMPRYITQVANQDGWERFYPTSPMADSTPAYSAPPSNGYGVPAIAAPPVQQPQLSPDQLVAYMASMNLNVQNPVHRDQFRQFWAARQAQTAQQAARYPMYTANAQGTPVNIRNGFVQTEARGVFVSGLNYKAKTKEIETHFSKAGRIVKLDLQKDPSTGKSKGNATIQFSTAQEAQRAIEMFDRREFMKMRLIVRPDKETTAISAPPAGTVSGNQPIRSSTEPTIVNGSQARKDSAVSCV